MSFVVVRDREKTPVIVNTDQIITVTYNKKVFGDTFTVLLSGGYTIELDHSEGMRLVDALEPMNKSHI